MKDDGLLPGQRLNLFDRAVTYFSPKSDGIGWWRAARCMNSDTMRRILARGAAAMAG